MLNVDVDLQKLIADSPRQQCVEVEWKFALTRACQVWMPLRNVLLKLWLATERFSTCCTSPQVHLAMTSIWSRIQMPSRLYWGHPIMKLRELRLAMLVPPRMDWALSMSHKLCLWWEWWLWGWWGWGSWENDFAGSPEEEVGVNHPENLWQLASRP